MISFELSAQILGYWIWAISPLFSDLISNTLCIFNACVWSLLDFSTVNFVTTALNVRNSFPNILKYWPDGSTTAGKYAIRTSLWSGFALKSGCMATSLVWILIPPMKSWMEPRTMVKRDPWEKPSNQQWAAVRTRVNEMREPPHMLWRVVWPWLISVIIPACNQKDVCYVTKLVAPLVDHTVCPARLVSLNMYLF